MVSWAGTRTLALLWRHRHRLAIQRRQHQRTSHWIRPTPQPRRRPQRMERIRRTSLRRCRLRVRLRRRRQRPRLIRRLRPTPFLHNHRIPPLHRIQRCLRTQRRHHPIRRWQRSQLHHHLTRPRRRSLRPQERPVRFGNSTRTSCRALRERRELPKSAPLSRTSDPASGPLKHRGRSEQGRHRWL